MDTTIIYGYIHILLIMYVYIAVSVTIVCLWYIKGVMKRLDK